MKLFSFLRFFCPEFRLQLKLFQLKQRTLGDFKKEKEL
jgi:hypothetical protein